MEEALGLRKVVQESNKVFEIESLSVDTFRVPPPITGPNPPGLTEGVFFTGEVTCSVPFSKLPWSLCTLKLALIIYDRYTGRSFSCCYWLCWRGLDRVSSRFTMWVYSTTKCLILNHKNKFTAMSRVLHLKKVTQCAVLDEFGLFLVLADKVLLLCPS